MRAGASEASMRSVLRYRILVEGRLSARFASSLEGMDVEPREAGTALVADVDTAAELDSILERLGDLGLELVSLEQERRPG